MAVGLREINAFCGKLNNKKDNQLSDHISVTANMISTSE